MIWFLLFCTQEGFDGYKSGPSAQCLAPILVASEPDCRALGKAMRENATAASIDNATARCIRLRKPA